MISGVEDMAAPHRPEAGVWPQESLWVFWQGVLLGVGTAVSTMGVLVLSHILNRGHNS
jgi:hypothetical protein